jgi:predicted membrane protein
MILRVHNPFPPTNLFNQQKRLIRIAHKGPGKSIQQVVLLLLLNDPLTFWVHVLQVSAVIGQYLMWALVASATAIYGVPYQLKQFPTCLIMNYGPQRHWMAVALLRLREVCHYRLDTDIMMRARLLSMRPMLCCKLDCVVCALSTSTRLVA